MLELPQDFLDLALPIQPVGVSEPIQVPQSVLDLVDFVDSSHGKLYSKMLPARSVTYINMQFPTTTNVLIRFDMHTLFTTHTLTKVSTIHTIEVLIHDILQF